MKYQKTTKLTIAGRHFPNSHFCLKACILSLATILSVVTSSLHSRLSKCLPNYLSMNNYNLFVKLFSPVKIAFYEKAASSACNSSRPFSSRQLLHFIMQKRFRYTSHFTSQGIFLNASPRVEV